MTIRNDADGPAVAFVLIRLPAEARGGAAMIIGLDDHGGEGRAEQVAAALDGPGLATVSAAIRRELGAGRARFIIDTTDAGWIDSTLLGWLVSLHETITRAGGALAVVMRMDRAAAVLKITRLDRVLVVCETVAAARDRLAGGPARPA